VSALWRLRDDRQRTIAARRADSRDDLISALIAVEEAGDRLTDTEIVTVCELLLAAGNVRYGGSGNSNR
jgi:cytochrome P450